MSDEQTTTSANDSTGAPGDGKAPESTGGNTLLGGDPGKQEGTQVPEKPAGAPEKYEDFKLPEGVTVDKATMEQAVARFREAGYSQEQAQAAVDLHIKNIQEQNEAFVSTRKEWVEELKADKEFGGAQFDSTVQGAALALRKFDADGGMYRLLEDSGFGDNPTVIRFLARVNKALGEDTVHTERSRAESKEPLEHRLYGKDGMGPQNNQ